MDRVYKQIVSRCVDCPERLRDGCYEFDNIIAEYEEKNPNWVDGDEWEEAYCNFPIPEDCHLDKVDKAF